MSDDEREESDETRLKETKELVRSVLKDVHEEYYEWEQEDCTAAIAALTVIDEEDVVDESTSSLTRAESYTESWSSAEASVKMSNAIDQQNVYFYSGNHTTDDPEDEFIAPIFTQTTQAPCIVQAPPLTPCAAYDFCTPSSRSMHVGDDSSALQFIPFPDSTLEEMLDYAQMHKHFAWQMEHTDTDREQISVLCSNLISNTEQRKILFLKLHID